MRLIDYIHVLSLLLSKSVLVVLQCTTLSNVNTSMNFHALIYEQICHLKVEILYFCESWKIQGNLSISLKAKQVLYLL